MKALKKKIRPTDTSKIPEKYVGPEEPCNPAMTLEGSRIRSFSDWPHKNEIPPRNMAVAGFYYTGTEDKVKCFFCDLCLNKWEPGDDPLKEHLKHRSICSYIKDKTEAEKPTSSEDETGQFMIRDYRIIQKLSKGSFGIVYKVTRNKQEYAIKEMQSLFTNRDSAAYELLFALEKKKHKNLVGVRDFFSDLSKDNLYIVMEYCGGGSLNDHVINEKPRLKEICCYMEDMANGLNFLHEGELMHRDLKPENVLLAVPNMGRMICKLADFGLTKALPHGQEAFFSFCGTEMYMAPEINGPNPYSFSADIFSLGLVFFVAATRKISRRHPSLLEPRLDKMGNKLINEIVDPSLDKQKFSKLYFRDQPDLGDLVADMVSFVPEDRPTARDVLSKVKYIRQLFVEYEEKEENE